MADKKIVGLTAITTLSSTDLRETSLAGAGSRKETRLQEASYMSSNPYGLITGQNSYITGTASQSGTTITGSGTTWTRSMLGARFIWPDGTALVITQVTSATSLVVSASKTQTSTTYQIISSGNNLLGNYWGIPSNCYGDLNLQNDLTVMGGLSTSGNDADSLGYSSLYNTGTVSQSGSTVTGSGTTFTSAMVGGVILFFGSTLSWRRAIITAFNSTTSLTVDTSDTISAGTTYSIRYGNLNIKGSYIGVSGLTLLGNFSVPLSSASGGTGVASPTIHKLPVAQGASAFNFLGPLTNGQLLVGFTNNDPVPAVLEEGYGISIVNGAGSITISSNGNVHWETVSGTFQSMNNNTGYIANDSSLVALLLPPTASVGDCVHIQGTGTGLLEVTQGSGQLIHVDDLTTTTGTGGKVQLLNQFGNFIVRCIIDNTTWVLESPFGNFNVI